MAYQDCEFCAFHILDEDTDEDICDLSLDEDEYARFLLNQTPTCPYFRSNDEYEIVRHQN